MHCPIHNTHKETILGSKIRKLGEQCVIGTVQYTIEEGLIYIYLPVSKNVPCNWIGVLLSNGALTFIKIKSGLVGLEFMFTPHSK